MCNYFSIGRPTTRSTLPAVATTVVAHLRKVRFTIILFIRVYKYNLYSDLLGVSNPIINYMLQLEVRLNFCSSMFIYPLLSDLQL